MAAKPALTTVESPDMRPGMSLSDYLARGDERFEIINGREVPMSPTSLGHDVLKQDLFLNLYMFAQLHALGNVAIERAFVDPASATAQWVTGSVIPDIIFIAGNRFEAYRMQHPNWAKLPMPLVPDLAIEIVSSNDRKAAILEKIGYMLDLGVQVVWSINPIRQSIIVYTPDADEVVLTGDDRLTTDLLPGWSIAVHDLFSSTFGA